VTSSSPAPRWSLVLLLLLVGPSLVACGGLDDDPTLLAVPSVDVVLVDPETPLPPVACDWDGDGGDTFATVTDGRWVVRDGRGVASYADSVVFGQAPGDVPVCGDWDGDGDDEPGVFRAGTFHLRSDLTASATTTVASIGGPRDVPVVGDWDGDGVDTPGVFHGEGWLLAGRPDGGEVERREGRLEPGDRTVVGDWDGDGVDTIALVRGDAWSTGPDATDLPTHHGDPGPGGVPLAVAVAGGVDRPTVVRPSTEASGPVSIAVFGDSLASESQAAFRQAISTGRDRPVEVAYASYGGTAVCDYHEEIAWAATGARPDLVVLSFSGNNITGCTLLEPGEGTCPAWATDVEVWRLLESCRRRGADLSRQYLDDVRWAVASLGRIPVVLVAPPTMADPVTGENPRPGTGRAGWIWKAYREVAAEHPNVTLVDGGALLTPDDRWVEELPCLPGEDCPPQEAGSTAPATAVVRSPDGIHLCSGAFAGIRTDGGCPVGMPGPYRFAAVTADAAAEVLGL
jgi:hypothetical protein